MPSEGIFTVNEEDRQPSRIFGEPIFSVPEASRESHLSEWTLWDLLKQGKIARTKVAGKTFIRLSELQKLVSDKVNKSAKPRPKAAAAAR